MIQPLVPNIPTLYEMRLQQYMQPQQQFGQPIHFSESFINTCNPYQNFLNQTYNHFDPMDNYQIHEPLHIPTLYENRIAPETYGFSESFLRTSNPYWDKNFVRGLKSSWE